MDRARDHWIPAKIPSGLRGSAGQAVVEYLLVLVVVLGIIFGALYQFSSAFQVWANNYFGEYLACLIETGELPALGGDPGTGECDQIFAPFTLANGRPYTGGGGVGGGDGSRSGGSSSESSSSAATSGAAGTVGSGSSGRGGRSLRFLSSSSSGRGGSWSGGEFGAEREEKINTGNTNVTNYGSGPSSSDVPVKQYDGFSGGVWKSEKEEETKKIPVTSVKKETNRAPAAQARLKVVPPKKDTVKMDDDVSLTFGDYLKYLLVAAILIALLIFLGGQALQMSKGSE